jgi:ATP-dependent DNA ligase
MPISPNRVPGSASFGTNFCSDCAEQHEIKLDGYRMHARIDH